MPDRHEPQTTDILHHICSFCEPMVALYRSPGFVGWAIRKQTRSEYSHAALILRQHTDGRLWIVEAWHQPMLSGGRVREGYSDELHPGQTPDVFGVQDIHCNGIHAAREEAVKHLGERYDFRGVLRFVSRLPYSENHRWFCSELVAHCLDVANVPPFNCEPHKVSPGLLAYSPRLVKLSPRSHESHEEHEGNPETEGRNTHTSQDVRPCRTVDQIERGVGQIEHELGSVVPSSPLSCSSCDSWLPRFRPADGPLLPPTSSSTSSSCTRRQGLSECSAGVPPAPFRPWYIPSLIGGQAHA